MSKTFTSKSLGHLGSYSFVQSAKSYVLSYRYFAVLANYLVALINSIQMNVVAKSPLVRDFLKTSDAKFDAVVLCNIDAVLVSESYKKIEKRLVTFKERVGEVARTYRAKGAQAFFAFVSKVKTLVSPYKKQATAYAENALCVVVEYKKKGEETVSAYLKPVNDFASSALDKVLPKSKKTTDESKTSAETELAKSMEIVNDTYERSRDLISSKSSEVTSVVLSTYNREFDSTADKNYYVKVASASVNTGVALLKNVNSDYIQPLKETTQSYVQESITNAEEKAEDVVSETTNAVENVSVKLNGSLNGAIPVVSASA
ncbi:hypothetical protein METBIDRAFT_30059 [Metschnikowia bicuspidata var. bicuspidata NRRL YB-4993]|uniref:Uncharacterized protein n=1 Tax=Metschnikowia bicuspidata var. bicuspidata NRRL YB-4993 TaxID=869754 RepID=A0A1A0HHZ2_9ASCO|nr:hypothetical protein METBIDRAFT_30059 [Metschnikowia bicuspidata var. bicuspidata NRRL YB-4993]OBA23621.1 hypothetical protein METBIDRAFT_30059 [Metschnikowia bicuspidata var. bicuspidata NRRL YB-4993]